MILLYIIKQYFTDSEQSELINLYTQFYNANFIRNEVIADNMKTEFVTYFYTKFNSYIPFIKEYIKYFIDTSGKYKYDSENSSELLFDNWYDLFIHRSPICVYQNGRYVKLDSPKTIFKSGIAPYPLEKFQTFCRPDNLTIDIINEKMSNGFYNIPIWHHDRKCCLSRYRYSFIKKLYDMSDSFIRDLYKLEMGRFSNGNNIFSNSYNFILDASYPFLTNKIDNSVSIYGGLNNSYYMYYYHSSPLVLKMSVKKTLIFDTKLHAMIFLVTEYCSKFNVNVHPIDYITRLFNLNFNETINDQIFNDAFFCNIVKFRIQDYKKIMYISDCEDRSKTGSILNVHIKKDGVFTKLEDYSNLFDIVTYNNYYIEHIDLRFYFLSQILCYEYLILLKEPVHVKFQFNYNLLRSKIPYNSTFRTYNGYYGIDTYNNVFRGGYQYVLGPKTTRCQEDNYSRIIKDSIFNFTRSMIVKISNDFKYNFIDLYNNITFDSKQSEQLMFKFGGRDTTVYSNVDSTFVSNVDSNVYSNKKPYLKFHEKLINDYEKTYIEFCKSEYEIFGAYFNMAI